MRQDAGDGLTGSGVEVGGSLTHAAERGEWGAAGLVRVAPGAGGRGLSLSVEPVWGSAGSGMQALWQHGASGLAAAPGSGGRVGAELGYGLAAEQLLVLHGRVAVE